MGVCSSLLYHMLFLMLGTFHLEVVLINNLENHFNNSIDAICGRINIKDYNNQVYTYNGTIRVIR